MPDRLTYGVIPHPPLHHPLVREGMRSLDMSRLKVAIRLFFAFLCGWPLPGSFESGIGRTVVLCRQEDQPELDLEYRQTCQVVRLCNRRPKRKDAPSLVEGSSTNLLCRPLPQEFLSHLSEGDSQQSSIPTLGRRPGKRLMWNAGTMPSDSVCFALFAKRCPSPNCW